MVFWIMVCGLFGGVFIFVYIKYLYWSFVLWIDFFFFFVIYRILWYGSILFYIGFMIYYLYMEFLFGVLGIFYFIS